MPSKAAVIARFVSFRSVPSRGVTVLTMDVPIERSEGVLEALGAPTLGSSIHVGFTKMVLGMLGDMVSAPALAGGPAPALAGGPAPALAGGPAPALAGGPVSLAGGEDETPPSAVLHGTFESYRMVDSRDALALSIEVPIERAHVVIKQLTIPTPKANIQVAIARLNQPPLDAPLAKRAAKSPGTAAVIRCIMRLKEPAFHRFKLGPSYVAGDPDGNEAEATEAVKRELGIRSRSEIGQSEEKIKEWYAMEGRFERWLQDGHDQVPR